MGTSGPPAGFAQGKSRFGYAAIRENYPDVWSELLFLESRFGPGAWQRREDGSAKPFSELADLGKEAFSKRRVPEPGELKNPPRPAKSAKKVRHRSGKWRILRELFLIRTLRQDVRLDVRGVAKVLNALSFCTSPPTPPDVPAAPPRGGQWWGPGGEPPKQLEWRSER